MLVYSVHQPHVSWLCSDLFFLVPHLTFQYANHYQYYAQKDQYLNLSSSVVQKEAGSTDSKYSFATADILTPNMWRIIIISNLSHVDLNWIIFQKQLLLFNKCQHIFYIWSFWSNYYKNSYHDILALCIVVLSCKVNFSLLSIGNSYFVFFA